MFDQSFKAVYLKLFCSFDPLSLRHVVIAPTRYKAKQIQDKTILLKEEFNT